MPGVHHSYADTSVCSSYRDYHLWVWAPGLVPPQGANKLTGHVSWTPCLYRAYTWCHLPLYSSQEARCDAALPEYHNDGHTQLTPSPRGVASVSSRLSTLNCSPQAPCPPGIPAGRRKMKKKTCYAANARMHVNKKIESRTISMYNFQADITKVLGLHACTMSPAGRAPGIWHLSACGSATERCLLSPLSRDDF